VLSALTAAVPAYAQFNSRASDLLVGALLKRSVAEQPRPRR
jgi:hypothetical protein